MQAFSFFQLNQGKWITQRTIYKIYANEIYTYQSEMIINSDNKNNNQKIFNDKLDASLLNNKFNLYMQDKFDPDHFAISLENLRKNNQTDLIKKQYSRTKNFFNFYTNNIYYASVKNIVGNIINFEKIWFINSNLRLSISLIEKNNKCIITSFSSDIRIG